MSEWKAGYTIFAFNVTPGPRVPGTRSQQTTGSASLHLKFGIALPNVIEVLLYAEYGATLQIDQYNNTITV